MIVRRQKRMSGRFTVSTTAALRVLLGLLAPVPFVFGSELHAASRKKPNIILICADDLGIGMLGCYGQQRVKTPNIDRLAREGMRFTRYYGATLCAPARWTLMTGMHDGRKGGWEFNQAGLLIELDKKGVSDEDYMKSLDDYVEKSSSPIPDKEVFLAQIAKQAGYETAQFGKLDVGFLTNHRRVKRFGWDYYEGYYDHARCHGYYPPYLWRNGVKFELEGNTRLDCGKMSERGDEPVGSGGKTYSQDVFIDGILRYIRKHREEPFFLYHPTQLPHGPVAIPALHPDFADDPDLSLAEKKYASMVKRLDDDVGLIMKELKAQGIDQNTLVFFTSDNGHELYYGPKSTFPNRLSDGGVTNLSDRKWRTSESGDVFNGNGGRAGLKRTPYQGGVQCPLIVRWPDRIQPGTETAHLSAHYDFLATLAEIVGIDMPPGKDGLSYLPTLLGQPRQQVHEYVIINNRFNKMARTALITHDGWKLVETGRAVDSYQLYNLNDDNEERHDLSARYPQKVSSLKRKLLAELDSARPDLNPGDLL